MSIEAIAYVKSLPSGRIYRPARALVIVIAENTFNNTGECRVGQQVLCVDADISERTLRRYLQRVETAGVIARRPRGRKNGGRLTDAITLVGFMEWLAAVKSIGIEPAKLAGSVKPASTWPERTGQHVAGIEIESRTVTVLNPPFSPPNGGISGKPGDVQWKGGALARLKADPANSQALVHLISPLLASEKRLSLGKDAYAALAEAAETARSIHPEALAAAAKRLLAQPHKLTIEIIRNEIETARTCGAMVVIRRGSPNWQRWHEHYRTANPAFAAAMASRDTWQVPFSWPPAKGEVVE
jgi:hypothetical protein